MSPERIELGDYIAEGARSLLQDFPEQKSFWVKLLDVVGEGLFIVDADKRVVFFNRKAEKITGFRREEILGQHCIEAVRCINCLCECVLFEQGHVEDRDLEFITRDGRKITVVKNSTTFSDEEGKVIGGVELFRDVTEEQRLHRELAREKEKLETVLNSINDGVVAFDGMGVITFVNEQVEKIVGYKPEQLVGRSLHELHRSADGKPFDRLEMIDGTTATMRAMDGSERRIELRIISQLGAGENSAGNLVILRPVSPSERVAKQLSERHSYHGMISNHPVMIEIFNLVETISDSEVTVLIQGESGTGKEMLARALHATSRRKEHPMHIVNCAVFNENLLESELFGHCKGAFTGAVTDKVGRFELADGGTLFLDEIGELPPRLQVKLLRFLQDQTFERVGELRTRKVDVRIIAATNRDLLQEISEGGFRGDLYYRLNVIPINLPPLLDRLSDISLLADDFIRRFSENRGKAESTLSAEASQVMESHAWPGNIRELENVLTHALTCCNGPLILPSHLPAGFRSSATSSEPRCYTTAEEAEREAILDGLRRSGFNKTRASKLLGITRTTLWRKMKRFGL